MRIKIIPTISFPMIFTRYRNDAALWSKLFTASVAVGVVGGVAGGTVFAI